MRALPARSPLRSTDTVLVTDPAGRLGRDPAFGSGPLATVIQDLVSILVYFAVSDLLLG